MRRLCFYELFDAVLFFGFSWIEKGGLFLNVALFFRNRISRWQMLLKRGTGSGERGAGSGEQGTGNGSLITSSQQYPP